MTVDVSGFDAHEQPSAELRAQWKACSKSTIEDLVKDPSAIDDINSVYTSHQFNKVGEIPAEALNKSFGHLCDESTPVFQMETGAPIFSHPLMPGQSNPPM